MRGWEVRITHAPHSRDALTRAKDANPTTLLTRFAEPASPRLRSPREWRNFPLRPASAGLRRTCRRAPEAGGGGEERLLFRLGGGFGSVGFQLGVVGLHILKGLGDFIGRFFGGGGDFIGSLNRGGVEFGSEVGLNLLQFVDGFRQLGADRADLFVHIGVLFFRFVQSGLADGFEVALHFGEVGFPIFEAFVGNSAKVVDAFGQGGLNLFVVAELVGEVFEGVAGLVGFGGYPVELLDRFLEFFGGLVDEGFDFFEVSGHLPSFFGCFLGGEGEGKEGDKAEEGSEFHGE